MITVWGRATSSNVQIVMWALAEIGLECKRIDVGGSFGGTEVRQAEAKVGRDDPDQRDAGKIVALGDHLRADEQVQLAPAEPPQHVLHRPAALNRVAVDAPGANRREQPLDLRLHAIRPEAELLQVWRCALHAGSGHAHRVVAVMAERSGWPGSPAVDGERDAAVRAFEDVPALPAQHAGGKSPPV